MSPRALHPGDFLGDGNGSFGYYQLLPGDRPVLAPEWPRVDLAELGRQLDGVAHGDLVESDVDALSLALLALGEDGLPTGPDWYGIATQMSLLYSKHLKPGGARPVRMKAARANFYLRDRLDAMTPICPDLIDERRFTQPYVWDWLPLPDGELVADSSELNVTYRSHGAVAMSARMGLPTQIDAIGGARYALSSCYSDGWHEWGAPDVREFHHHPRPVVLVFAVQDVLHFLDREGVVYHAQSGRQVVRVPVETVWRARQIGTKIYISDWAEPCVLTVVNTQDWTSKKIDTAPVLVTNDIFQLNEHFYLLDKMQGRIFSFDSHFKFIDTRMSFGKRRGQLYDPITLRVHDDHILVVSWLTGALATVKPF